MDSFNHIKKSNNYDSSDFDMASITSDIMYQGRNNKRNNNNSNSKNNNNNSLQQSISNTNDYDYDTEREYSSDEESLSLVSDAGNGSHGNFKSLADILLSDLEDPPEEVEEKPHCS